MITDPTTLFALALFVGILGLVVLILPLLILFWSQMEPQLAGMVAPRAGETDDEYASLSVLPKLMKSFGHLADQASVGGKSSPTRARGKTQRKPASTPRSKASPTDKTVKTAPTKRKPASTSSGKRTSSAKPKAKPKSKSGATKAPSATTTRAKRAATTAKVAPKRRTPAGAKRDPILGIVYSKKPKAADDLKEIKGVGKVIEGKLHKAGIYTFRQIAEWDEAAVDGISEKLSFRGRIRNEAWQKQCVKFL